jgi:Leucine-rich repeat (LRR) protein
LKKLTYLNLSSTQINSIEHLRNLPNLKELYIKESPIKELPQWVVDWKPEFDLAKLFTYLPLQNPPVGFVKLYRKGIKAFFDLCKGIRPSHNGKPLTEHQCFEQLIKPCFFSDQLRYHFNEAGELVNLYLDFKDASNLRVLSIFKKLKYLVVSGKNISDVSPLTNFQSLRFINFFKTRVSDISPLKNLKELKELVIIQAPISDISSLSDFKGLKSLKLIKTDIKDFSVLKYLTQ